MNRKIDASKLKLFYSEAVEKILIKECQKLLLVYKFNILLKKELINNKEYELLIKKFI